MLTTSITLCRDLATTNRESFLKEELLRGGMLPVLRLQLSLGELKRSEIIDLDLVTIAI